MKVDEQPKRNPLQSPTPKVMYTAKLEWPIAPNTAGVPNTPGLALCQKTKSRSIISDSPLISMELGPSRYSSISAITPLRNRLDKHAIVTEEPNAVAGDQILSIEAKSATVKPEEPSVFRTHVKTITKPKVPLQSRIKSLLECGGGNLLGNDQTKKPIGGKTVNVSKQTAGSRLRGPTVFNQQIGRSKGTSKTSKFMSPAKHARAFGLKSPNLIKKSSRLPAKLSAARKAMATAAAGEKENITLSC